MKRTLLFFTVLFLALTVSARRPKVGLVLSGGGARGAAEIGALKFIDKYELPFPLIADTENSLVEQFGVWGEKSMYGRKYFGTFRTTFLINEDGIVERIFLPKEIKTKTHGEQILEAIRS